MRATGLVIIANVPISENKDVSVSSIDCHVFSFEFRND